MRFMMGFQRLITAYIHDKNIQHHSFDILPSLQEGCLFLFAILVIAHLFNVPAIDFHNTLLTIIEKSYRLITLSQDSPVSFF